MNTNKTRFVRPMTRREVARCCFDSENPVVAVARLNRWLKADIQLLTELKACGYRPRIRRFTPKQVRVFHKYLL